MNKKWFGKQVAAFAILIAGSAVLMGTAQAAFDIPNDGLFIKSLQEVPDIVSGHTRPFLTRTG
jgi:hypothetical protein